MNKQTMRLIWASILLIWLCIIALVTLIITMRILDSRAVDVPETAVNKNAVVITVEPAPIVNLDYTIDKSAVPALSFNELTYNLLIGNNTEVQLSNAAGQIPFEQIGNTIQFTTDADTFTLTLPTPLLTDRLGEIFITTLKNNRAWAWSHGFDDNVFLQESIRAFEARGYRGTLFLIMRDVWEDREEDWTLDEPQLKRLLANGWSLGNHSWAHECNSDFDYEASISTGYDRLFEVVSRSDRPNYRLAAFAAPCFDEAYNPYILQMRDNQTSQVLFSESGGDYLLRVDSGATESVFSEEKTAVPFTFDLPIGRDGNADIGADVILANFDWLSRNATDTQHLWYNTLAHGQNEATINTILDYLDQNYKEEVWVAPSDEIYSYLLLREGVGMTISQK